MSQHDYRALRGAFLAAAMFWRRKNKAEGIRSAQRDLAALRRARG